MMRLNALFAQRFLSVSLRHSAYQVAADEFARALFEREPETSCEIIRLLLANECLAHLPQKQNDPPRQFPDVEGGRCRGQALARLYFWLIQRTLPSSRMGFQPSVSMPCKASPLWAIITDAYSLPGPVRI